MSTFVMSDKYPCFVNELQRLGHRVIRSDTVEIFLAPEQKHADMQILPINDKIFILNECKSLAKNFPSDNLIFCNKKAGEKYPENILLNFLFFGNTIYGKISAIDSRLLDYCRKNKIRTVNINQGYARCSTLVVAENAAVTADLSIASSLSENGAEVLLISQGNIELDGYDYGFIGGAGGRIDDNTVIFFGNIEKHPDYISIKEFCAKHSVTIKCLCKNMPLTDIGGIVKV